MAGAREIRNIVPSRLPRIRSAVIGRAGMLLAAATLLAALGPSESNAAVQGPGRCARAQREARSLAYLWVDTPTGGRIYRTDPEEQPLEVVNDPEICNSTVIMASDGKPCFICRGYEAAGGKANAQGGTTDAAGRVGEALEALERKEKEEENAAMEADGLAETGHEAAEGGEGGEEKGEGAAGGEGGGNMAGHLDLEDQVPSHTAGYEGIFGR
ncbi:hypothetical protein T484DRAFT_1893117 [Baffinella frigidus]|nr:hypothetical protein T484DRAFT_1893117 [Cryptophyta sp. CCMP2293]